MDTTEFYELAKEKFGDKFVLGSELKFDQESVDRLNEQSDSIAEITDRMGRCQIKSSDDVAELELLQEILLKEGFKVEIKKV